MAGRLRSAQSEGAFAALDFETASSARDSACALAVVRVEFGAVVAKRAWLIRPPTERFQFTHIHQIAWEDVCNAPVFADVWQEAAPLCRAVSFFAAHNAAFDRAVLDACCRRAGIARAPTPFRCTVQMARSTLGIFPTTLPDVCTRLGIPLRHHDALSDAEACARIVIAVQQTSACSRGGVPL